MHIITRGGGGGGLYNDKSGVSIFIIGLFWCASIFLNECFALVCA